MPSIRPLRKSSRTSSPFPTSTSSLAPGLVVKKEKSQTSLDSWVEPPPKNPTASFEEHGFARHGVLENMAPLGQPPTAKLKAKLRGGSDMHRLSLLGKNGNVSTGEDALSTPEMTPAAEPEQAETEQLEDEVVLPPSLEPQDEDEDDEYVPNGVRSVSRSGKSAMKNGVSAVTPHRDAIVPPTSATPTTRTPAQNQIVLKAVNAAMKKAQDDGRPSVSEAVRRLYDDSCHNQSYAHLLDAILNERSTTQEIADFRAYIKSAKKMARARDRRALGTRTNSQLGSTVSHAKTRNSSLTPARPADNSTTIAAAPTTPSIHTIAAQPNLPAPSGLNPLSNVPHLPPNPSPKKSLFTPSRPTTPPPKITANGNSSRLTEMVSTRRQARAAAPPQGDPPPAVPAKQPLAKTPKSPKPKGKASKAHAKAALENTDSELSDVNEDIMNEPPEDMLLKDDDLAAPPKTQKARLILKNNPKPSLGKRPKSSTATPAPTSGKRSADEAGIDDDENEIQVKKQKMIRAFPDFNPEFSDMRLQEDTFTLPNGSSTSLNQIKQFQPSSAAPRRSGRSRNGASQGPQPAPNAAGLLAAQKQNGAKAEATSSDLASPPDGTPDFTEFSSPARVESAVPSRPVTRPTTPAVAHPAKRRKPNNGPAKTKFSPVKGKGAAANAARAIGGPTTQVGAEDSDSESDEDVCASCGLGGLIIGCDHCEDWYHFACAKPPIAEGVDAPDDFVCHKCRRLFAAAEASRAAPTKYTWVATLESALPGPEAGSRWYRLPDGIRDYFEGVKTNADGGYEEAPAREIALDKQKGYFAKPDPYKLIDHGKVILCHGCSKSAVNKRDIIKCDFCPNYWHLDCLDPPAAVSPVAVTASGMTRRAWKCPLHIDHDLKSVAEIPTETFNGNLKRKRASSPNLDSDATVLRHRIRRPKVLTPQDVALPRGLRNNGIIEVVNNEDESDDEEDWVYDDKESRPEDAVLKRIPKPVIIADFIGSVKRRRMNEQVLKAKVVSRIPTATQKSVQPKATKNKVAATLTNGATTSIFSRPIVEQQAAIQLAQFAQKEQDIGLTAGNVHSLVGNLIAEASPDVVALVSEEETVEGDAAAALERQYYEKLQALIARKLNGANIS